MHERGDQLGLGFADLGQARPLGPELGRGVADRSEGAEYDELPLCKGQSPLVVEIAEAELGQELGECVVERFGRSATVPLISFPYSES